MQTTRALVERFYHEVWNRHDETVAREILHADFIFHASLGLQRHGPDGFIAYLRAVHEALGNFTCNIEEVIENGNRAAVRLRFVGKHRGRLFGVAATGKEVVWSGAAFFTADERQITELWVLGDVDAVRTQLGAVETSPFEV